MTTTPATAPTPPNPPPSHDRARRLTLAGYGATVFLSSALLLVLEIVAGRLVAPYIGVSLYTWTSIIGVILAGLSLGNWLGGVWADRGGSGRSVGLVLVLGGLYCLAALGLLDALAARLQAADTGLILASFVFAAVLFFVPAALIGVVTPLLTTLALRLDGRTGHVVGRMHALAAVGSIAGTFAAGYWLVQALGSRNVVLLAGLLLLALGLPFLRRVTAAARLSVLAALAALGALLALGGGLTPRCDRESAYFCIRVVDESARAPFGEARGLVLDHLLHGINHRDDPALLIAPYVHAIDELVHAHAGAAAYQQGLRWFFAGGGAYSQPRAALALAPAARITVAELDPAVTRTAIEALFVAPAQMRILHRDARVALRAETGPFDVIVGDVFHDLAVPAHLLTREFAALVRARLTPDGLYALNLVDAFPDPRLLKAVVRTLATEFTHVDLWMEGVPEAARVTFVITATNGARLPKTVVARTGLPRAWHRMTEDVLGYGTPPARLPILTDDHAPVERLIANLLLGPGE